MKEKPKTKTKWELASMSYLRKYNLRTNMNDNVTITKLADVRTICISC